MCVIFATSDIILRTKPLQQWGNASQIVRKHLQTEKHLEAQARASEFIRIGQGKQPSVVSSLSKANADKIARNKVALKTITETIILCGKQNIPLREHTDDRSNFLSVLNYRAQADKALKKHMNFGPRNATYVSHRIQNELIELCGDELRTSIMQKCKEAKWFSLLADETADISNIEQVSICLRFVDKSDDKYNVNECFLTFCPTRDTKGCTPFIIN